MQFQVPSADTYVRLGPIKACLGAHDMPRTFTVHLDIKHRGDFLFASSRDVPGLHVTGSDEHELRAAAMRSAKDLFKRNKGMTVEVLPTDDFAELRIRAEA